MRILYFIANAYTIGGAAKVIATQAQMMNACGHVVMVVLQDEGENRHPSIILKKMLESQEIEVAEAYFSVATCLEEVDVLKSIGSTREIMNIMNAFMPDLVHSSQINLAAEFASRELNIPHLMNVYPVDEASLYIDWMNFYPTYHSCDSLFFCDKWRRLYGIKSECIRVAYQENKYVNRIFPNKRKSAYECLCVGVFSKYKNQIEVIRFVELCISNAKNVHVSFLGEYNTEYGLYCREYVKKNKLENHIEFVGVVENVEKYMREADFLIHLSYVESYPGVIVEAIGNELPVIVSNVGGVSELLKDGESCFFTDNNNADGAFNAFRRMEESIEDCHLRTIIENAHNVYLLNHTFDAVSSQLNDYYDYILNDYSESRLKLNDAISVFHAMDYSSYSLFTQERIWYITHLKRVIKDKNINDCVIWGSGKMGKTALEWVELLGIKAIGYIDSKKTGYYLGLPIIAPTDEIINKTGLVIVSIGDFGEREAIIKRLYSLGKERNIDFILMHNSPCLINES